MIDLKIENIVFSAKLAEKFDVQFLSKQFINSKYNLDEFSGLILDFDNPKCAVFLFPNGKIICTGIKNVEDIEIIINRITNDIEKYKITIFDDIHIDIENIIASSKLAQNLDLEYVRDHIEFENILYNKNDFPNLQFAIPTFKINAIIFKSGKIVFIDGTDLEDVKKAFRLLKENLIDIGIL